MDQKIKIGAMVPRSTFKDLQKIARWYRTENLSHALRLLIEDTSKGIDLGSKPRDLKLEKREALV